MENKYLKRTILKREVKSSHLGETRDIQIYLPPDYDERYHYPVLYLQDGDDYFNLGRLATRCNQMILDGEIVPIIAVAVPVDKKKRTAEYSPVGERNKRYKSFFLEELIPAVENEFPTGGSVEDRVLGGSSLGGTVSLHLALDYPLLFQRVLSQSGAFLKATLEAIRQSPDLSHLEIYQSIGKSETAVSTHMGILDLLTRNREVHRALQEQEARVLYREKEGDHTWGLWQQDLPEALRFFFGK
ncbi:hypothetical protein GCM10011571_06880 [Marinithermofilum abyssi]|uniref:Enterochelin esterase n=1 Tax=Marinithermofilum abyssi TaxID=1571185 RepID=A0A8J2YBV2_9BACL|nr:alpha/beta hydrolase-fold protein [Marinithermofilum abyssi]GGE08260.1 hypothetical protein GCM10011571_06880 [Marinithermofilum abyssi]